LKQNEGLVFFNSDNSLLSKLPKPKKQITYGSEDADCLGTLTEENPNVKFTFLSKEGNTQIETNLPGKYNFENALAACTIGEYFGVSNIQKASALKKYHSTNNRSQIIERDTYSILLDAYNANPSSMEVAINSFILANANHSKLLILGDMFELGSYSVSEHKKTINFCIKKISIQSSYTEIILVGKNFYKASQENNIRLPNNCKILLHKDSSGVTEYLKTKKGFPAKILIKGSRGMHLEEVLEPKGYL